ncbi:hypothetical protein MASR2M44_05250 [Bacteroidota bacterium]
MKKALLPLLFIMIAISASLAQTKEIKVYFLNQQKEKVFLEKRSYYDTELKPTKFFLGNPDKNRIYIIEVYRTIDSMEHFYKSWSLTELEIEQGFSIDGMFTDVVSPFINLSSFSIKICLTNKQNFLRLKRREECDLSQSYRIILGN